MKKNLKRVLVSAATGLLLFPVAFSASSSVVSAASSDGSALVISVDGKKTNGSAVKSNSVQSESNVSNVSDITQNEYFDKNNISYYITPGLPSGLQQDVRAAALQWNISTNVHLFETRVKKDADIVFTNNGTSSSENGLTTNTINRSRGFTEVISSKIDLSKNTIPNSKLSTMGRRVAEHEFGHALGLKDTRTDSNGTIMWYKTPNTDITAKDVAAINQYYK